MEVTEVPEVPERGRKSNWLRTLLRLLTLRGAHSASVAVGDAPVAACALLALYGAVDQLTALHPLRQGTVL